MLTARAEGERSAGKPAPRRRAALALVVLGGVAVAWAVWRDRSGRAPVPEVPTAAPPLAPVKVATLPPPSPLLKRVRDLLTAGEEEKALAELESGKPGPWEASDMAATVSVADARYRAFEQWDQFVDKPLSEPEKRGAFAAFKVARRLDPRHEVGDKLGQQLDLWSRDLRKATETEAKQRFVLDVMRFAAEACPDSRRGYASEWSKALDHHFARYEEAIAVVESLIAADAKPVAFHVARANILTFHSRSVTGEAERKQVHAEARREIAIALGDDKLEPVASVQLHNMLADMALRESDPAAALVALEGAPASALKETEEKQPDWPVYHARLLFLNGRGDDAAKLLRERASHHDASVQDRFAKAVATVMSGRPRDEVDAALGALQLALSRGE